MALVWERTLKGVSYQVRTAGRSVRLYENGILHSQVNPQRLFTGSVWDLLSIPALMLPPGSIRRVLVLGVGGGMVIRQLQALIGPVQIVGIEYNPLHLKLAKRFFGLDDSFAELVCAEAGEWVRNYQGEPFDLIIDDIFAEIDGQPARAIAADAAWINDLVRILSPHGGLLTNFVSVREFRTAALSPVKLEPVPFVSGFSLSTPHCENIISAVFRVKVQEGLLESRLRTHPVCQKKSVLNRLRYRARKFR